METRPVHLTVGRPVSTNTAAFLSDVEEICRTGVFTNDGPFCRKLEYDVSRYLGVKHAVAVSNATVGIALVLRALKLKKGGEVILPSYTFIATAHAVIEAGLKPVFCDVNLHTHLLTAENVEAVLSPSTVAILAVNLWGLPCCSTLASLAAGKRLPLVYDSAHSFGASELGGHMMGSYGTAHVFSMHATKLFNSFEGGLITTNDTTLAERLSKMRNFGFAQDQVDIWGTNAKLSEVHAAFACRQLESIERTKAVYLKCAEIYLREFNKYNLTGITYWNKDFLETGCTHAYICIQVDAAAPFSRDNLMDGLKEANIHAKRYFYPGIHKTRFYSNYVPKKTLTNTDILNNEILILPTGHAVAECDIVYIVDHIATLHLSASRSRG